MADPGSDVTIDDLIARATMGDIAHAYSRALDTRDASLLRSILMDEFVLDMESWSGVPPRRILKEEWIPNLLGRLSGFDATQHILVNPVVTVDGERATSMVYMMALHHLVEDGVRQMHAIGGYYNHSLVRVDRQWKISALKLTVTWEMGDREHLFGAAQARWQARSR